jgi:hypothetical protein
MRLASTARVNVPTGGRPAEALASAALQLTRGRPYVIAVSVHHDDDCPCLTGRSMHACTCATVELEAKRVA